MRCTRHSGTPVALSVISSATVVRINSHITARTVDAQLTERVWENYVDVEFFTRHATRECIGAVFAVYQAIGPAVLDTKLRA